MPLLLTALLLLAAACRADAGDTRGGEVTDAGSDTRRIVPEGLRVVALEGGSGGLELVALTLRSGPEATELYVAVRNGGATPACSAAVSVELFDGADSSLAAGIGGLLTQRFYRRTDGSDSIAACIGPGDVSMAAVLGLPPDIAIEDVKSIVYRCPYFALDVVPIEGIAIRDAKRATDGAGTTFTGTFVNGLEVAVTNPSVSVFPINRVGRPLGAATGSAALEVPPGGRWVFETGRVEAAGADFVVYPAGAL
jgi:hypothetical protein